MTTTDSSADAADRMAEQAAGWHAGSHRDDFDWHGFTVWLEADPHHRAVYDEIARIDALVAQNAGALMEHHVWSEDTIPVARPAWRRWLAGGAAVAAAAVAVVVLRPAAPAPQDIVQATGAGAATIALGDGSRVVLAPHSRLAIAPGGRALRLDGEAWLEIRHRPDRALTVTAGGLTITDVGTAFDVSASPAGVRVGVASGAVSVAAPGLARPLALGRGQQVIYDAAADSANVARVDPGTMGGWQSGHLTYDAAPLSLVVADLARYAAEPIVVAPEAQARRFSGTLALAGARHGVAGTHATAARRALDDLAGFMGLTVVRGAHGLVLGPRGGAAPGH